jgi:hypothetical protein
VPVMVEKPTSEVLPTVTFKKDSKGPPADSDKQVPEDTITTKQSYGHTIVLATRETQPDLQDKKRQAPLEAMDKKLKPPREKVISSTATAESKSLDGKSKADREPVPVTVEKPSQVRPTVTLKKDSKGPPADSEKQEPEDGLTTKHSYGHCI